MTMRLGGIGTCARSGGRIAAGFVLLGVLALLSGCASTGKGAAGDAGEIADAVPRVEPKSKYGNPKSYVVNGRRYHTKDSADGHVETGLASWYGKKFHGRRTSSGERYDMYAMTAAHKSLPLPTYVQVKNLQNGRSAVVRVNDRGPFHGRRVIDLSYAAAKKLGVVRNGTAMVEVRALDPRKPSSTGASENLFADAGSAIRSEPKPKSARKEAPAGAKRAAPEPADELAIQVASTSPGAKTRSRSVAKRTNASRILAASGDSAPMSSGAAALYLQVGAFGSRSNAEQLRRQLVGQLEEKVLVRTADGSKAPLYKVHVGPLDTRGEADNVSEKLASLGLTQSHVVTE